MIRKVLNTVIVDITFFGSLVSYGFFIALFFLLAQFFVSLKLVIGLVLITLLVILIRTIYHKPRPNKMKYKSYLEKIDASSYPSIHSARIWFLTFVSFESAFMYLPYLFVIVAIFVSFSRYYLKKHYAIDIIAGFALALTIYFSLFFI